MNDRTDRPTPIERQGAPDCLVALALEWLQQPIGGQSPLMCSQAIDEICLILSQLRHREPNRMEAERARWIERVAAHLCRQCRARGYEGSVRAELERRVRAALLTYHNWRETVAPRFGALPLPPSSPNAPCRINLDCAGPSDGGEVVA